MSLQSAEPFSSELPELSKSPPNITPNLIFKRNPDTSLLVDRGCPPARGTGAADLNPASTQPTLFV